jgi:hypothetical protein
MLEVDYVAIVNAHTLIAAKMPFFWVVYSASI